MNDTQRQDALLDFWFGPLPDPEHYPSDRAPSWWKKDEAFDAEIRTRFGAWIEEALAGGMGDWADTPRGQIAYVVLLDQLTRNAFRGSGRMFAGDAMTQALVRTGVERGDDRAMPRIHRAFFYMPLMHSEELADQERCVELFDALASEAPEATQAAYRNNHDFAIRHRDIVARFGRFPHRNALLGRESTPEELAFLEQPGSSF